MRKIGHKIALESGRNLELVMHIKDTSHNMCTKVFLISQLQSAL